MEICISIIVPVFNSESSIRRCIESVQAQTYKNWKLLLVDDGSTDRSSNICEEFLLDSRIRLFKKENGGVSSARNFAIDYINTPYFVFMDSDDYIEPEYLSELLAARNLYPKSGHIWCGFQEISSYLDNNPKEILSSNKDKYSIFDRNDIMTLYELWLLQSPVNKLYDTEVVQRHNIRMDETLSLSEDLLFNLAYLDSTDNTEIIVVNRPLYNYMRISEQSLDNKYRNDLFLIYQKSDSAMQKYLNKWRVSEEQRQIFYDVKFRKMERILNNTFHPDNKMKNVEKIKYNNQIVKSQEFQSRLGMRKYYINPLILWAYTRKNYYIVFAIEKLSRIKRKIMGNKKDGKLSK